jgi:ATPase subunit of ABC transporter with duplicated ATPase domains
VIVAHEFPLALAERSFRSLSPGERTRAALICLFQRSPAIELLVLDEPTFSLDLVGQRALTNALKAWSGGLVVASHDRSFLTAIEVGAVIELGR